MDKKELKKRKRGAFFTLFGGIVLGVILIAHFHTPPHERMTYGEYQEHLQHGDIDVVTYSDESEYMTIYLGSEKTEGLTDEELEDYDYEEESIFRVIYPANEDFKKELLEQGVLVRETQDGIFPYLASYMITFVELGFLLIVILSMKKMMSMNNGTASTLVENPDEIGVTLDDVIGHEEIKGDLKLLIKQMKNGKENKDMSHGILFEGDAGSGKTMLARAIAHDAGVNFINVNASNLVQMYVGVGAMRVRSAFKQAREVAPCVLFIDEIDAVGGKRGSRGNNTEHEQTINALLTELDGFSDKGNILVIAATNRADILDTALVRSGRFDRIIKVSIPQKWETRQELFDSYLKKQDYPLASDVDTETLAKQTTGFSGADIAAIVRETRQIVFREDANVIKQAYLEEAIDKKVFGGNRSNEEQHQKDLNIVAHHEAGHAVMMLLTNQAVSRVSIMGMTSGVGGVAFGSDNDSVFQTKKEYENSIMVAYAGRASEEIFFGTDGVTQGAVNDIEQATQILEKYVKKFGFGKNGGLIDYDELIQSGMLQPDVVVQDMQSISKRLYERTVSLVNENKSVIDKLAGVLLEKKSISGKNIIEAFENFGEPLKVDGNEIPSMRAID